MAPSLNYTRKIEEKFYTIPPPVFSEMEAPCPSRTPSALISREMYEIKEFKVASCLETLEVLRVPNLRRLTSETGKAVAAGTYDFSLAHL